MPRLRKGHPKDAEEGLPWPSSGEDSTLPLQGTRVRSLVRERRSHKLCGTAGKKKVKMQRKESTSPARALLAPGRNPAQV